MRIAALSLFLIGCAGPVEIGLAAAALTNDDAVNRAEEWVSNQLQYCQAVYGGTDYDQACWSMPWEMNDRCYRNSNPAWNPYRSDCSGLVSYAWGLPSPGRVTGEFAPFQTDITSAINGSDLRAGDAINNSDHIMLFKQWVTAGQRAIFIEEPGCSTTVKHAHEVTVDVTISGTSVTPSGYGASFTAIRYGALTVGPGSPPDPCAGLVDGSYCGGDGIGGDKGTLYVCAGGNVGSQTLCAAGCKFNPPGTPDACNPAPASHDGGTQDAPDGGAHGGAGPDAGPAASAPGAPSNDPGPPANADSGPAPQGGCSTVPQGATPSWLFLLAIGWLASRRRWV
jgi:uncharacterized protein (TIGR03382 family)